MRKATLLALLAVLALGLAAAASHESGSVGVQYVQHGQDGVLNFANAEGRHFLVLDAFGDVLCEGVVESDEFGTDCPNNGANQKGLLLRVRVEPDLNFAVGDRDDEWKWD